MSIQFLGMIGHRLASEIIPASGTLFDKDYIARFARAHEAAGFDRILVGYWSDQPDGFLVTAHAAAHTQKIKFLLAHRPGFVAPTLAARKLASLDHLTDGRLAVHIISGGSDSEQRRDGDFLSKAERYARTDEFLSVLKQSLESPQLTIIRAGFTRLSRLSLPLNRCNISCRSISADRHRRRLTWRRDMLMSSRCGANR